MFCRFWNKLTLVMTICELLLLTACNMPLTKHVTTTEKNPNTANLSTVTSQMTKKHSNLSTKKKPSTNTTTTSVKTSKQQTLLRSTKQPSVDNDASVQQRTTKTKKKTMSTDKTTSRARTTTIKTRAKKTSASQNVTSGTTINNPLFFPVSPNGQINHPDATDLNLRSITFYKTTCRLLLPNDLTVHMAGERYQMYAQLYRGNSRIGRLAYNFFANDLSNGVVQETSTVNGVKIQVRKYTSGNSVAFSYGSFIYINDENFYHLEIEANSITKSDFATCVNSFENILIAIKDTYPELSGSESLRITVAGNSYISTSDIANQLEQLFYGTQKNVQVTGFSVGMASTNKFMGYTDFMNALDMGAFDVLFMCGLFGDDDIPAMKIIEQKCQRSHIKLVLFPAYNENNSIIIKGIQNCPTADVLPWKSATEYLIRQGVTDTLLMVHDAHLHPRALGGYAGALMIYHYLYGNVPIGHAEIAMNSLHAGEGNPNLITGQVRDLIEQYMND